MIIFKSFNWSLIVSVDFLSLPAPGVWRCCSNLVPHLSEICSSPPNSWDWKEKNFLDITFQNYLIHTLHHQYEEDDGRQFSKYLNFMQSKVDEKQVALKNNLISVQLLWYPPTRRLQIYKMETINLPAKCSQKLLQT